MSLLWVQTVGLRTVSVLTDYADRMAADWVEHVSKAHGVSHEAARHALDTVLGHLHSGVEFVSPTDYGFASAPDRPYAYADTITQRHMSTPLWQSAPVVRVPGRSIHATQSTIETNSVAHHLFHPGHIEPERADGRPTDRPLLLRHARRHLTIDGHHRLAADLLLGKSQIQARVLDAKKI